MRHEVDLKFLPPGLEFPSDLRDKISYDPSRCRLIFVGRMSRTEFERLLRLSNDADFLRAVERLSQISTNGETKPAKSRRMTLGSTIAIAAALVGILTALLIFALRKIAS